jgi:hypothetical protein
VAILTGMKKLTLIAASALLVTLVAMSATVHAAGGQSIARTYQPSAMDSWLDQQNTTTNYGSDTTMTVKSWTAGPNNRNGRSVVQFDISMIPQGSTITSATLSLYASTVPGSTRTYYAHRITTSWAEGTVTWDSPWTTAGGDYADSTVSTTTPALAGWMSWDITTDVSDFIAATYSNYGWLIKDGTENGSNLATTFYTREDTTDTTLCPKLAVTFTAPWDSYSDTGRTTVCDSFANSTNVIYMKGTSFLDDSQTYNISYYDGSGAKIATDAGIALINVSGGRGQLGNTSSPYEPTYDFNSNPSASAGTWHIVVQPSGATAFPSDYSVLSGAPNTYQLIGDDTCSVDETAIPEFSTVMAAIGVAGLCFGIYYWMRKRMLAS